MKRPTAAVRGLLLIVACWITSPAVAQTPERIVGLPCEGCGWAFVNRPAQVPTVTRISPQGEPGEALRLEGTVRGTDGQPRAGVIVYAYHTDGKGIYPAGEGLGAAARHGRLRGWAATDADGRYRFDTIRPAGYPGTNIPQHIHLHVIEHGRCSYYLDDVVFTDDPRLTSAQRRLQAGRGGSGVITPTRSSTGWLAVRDITLGQNIPGYDACGKS
jgi:protocatechuate 3,4-dioxygenase beta subunit